MAQDKYYYESLTPVNDLNLDVYEDAFNYVFETPDIKNVAVSGSYSAGKSSILESYKKKHGDRSFLHISLAHFETPGQDEETQVKESVLEGKILNQLIHQIPEANIPQTNFRVKRRISGRYINKRAVLFAAQLLAVLYFVFFDSWAGYVSLLPDNWFKSMLSLTTHRYAMLADGLLIIFMLCLSARGIIKMQKNRNVFHRLSLQGNEIEIFEDSDDSYFDKYLNEVLYLFENAEADVIVFEDMDRFNANKIFERLREVNRLANIHFQKENKAPIRFFYLLRDDIFTSKDRTKFFDYIIPVIPVVDSSNSYNQFIMLFQRCGMLKAFDDSFLQGLSLYIDDMRLLKNIYNEFLIYYRRLNTIELDCNKMLAIITYKNLFPRDYSDLQVNRGFMYTLFVSRDRFARQEYERLNLLIEEKSREIERANSEHLESVHELELVFEEKKPVKWVGKGELSKEAAEQYQQRKAVIENRLNNRIADLEEEKAGLVKRLARLQCGSLCDIITRDNINEIFSVTSTNDIGVVTSFEEIKGSAYFDLIKYLVRNGYIDETYADYMTYFYDNSLSRTDKTFLRSVTDKKAKDYAYRLEEPGLLASRLRPEDYGQEEVLNFDLLTYLLKDRSRRGQLERLIRQLKNTGKFNFISAYFDLTTELAAFVRYVNMWWPEMFGTALASQLLTSDQLYKYSVGTLYYSDDREISLVNSGDCLSRYISALPGYLAMADPDIGRLVSGFRLTGVSFSGFDYDSLNKELFSAVYENSLYELNMGNICLMLRVFYGIEDEAAVLHKNYTQVKSQPEAALAVYIDENINRYLEADLQAGGGNIYDDETAAVEIINNTSAGAELKKLYIEALQTGITDIRHVRDTALWTQLLETDTAIRNEVNIMEYFNLVKSFDDSLINFINRHSERLDFGKVGDNYSDEQRLSFFNTAVSCSLIENERYKEIITTAGFYYKAFCTEGIPEDKLGILIDIRIIRMNSDTLKFMRKNYRGQVLHYIRTNIDEYIGIMDRHLYSREELSEIITWDIDDGLKLKLLGFNASLLSIVDKGYSPAVCIHILDNNFMKSDLDSLFPAFERWDGAVREKILGLAVKYITDIIAGQYKASKVLLDRLLRSDQLGRDSKINLFVSALPEMSVESIKSVLPALGLDKYAKLFSSRSRPKFESTSENRRLLEAFKKYGAICGYTADTAKEGYIKIIHAGPAGRAS